MRRSLFALFLIACISVVTLVSCGTTADYQGTVTSVTAEQIAINTFIGTDRYYIVGKVTGESEFVYYNRSKGEYVGDTKQYGYIYDHAKSTVGEGVFVGTGKVLNEEIMPEAQRIAKLNAQYKLLEEMKELGADTIFIPTYTVETDNSPIKDEVSYKVTVTALAISINFD